MGLKIFLSGAMEDVGDYSLNWRKTATHQLTAMGYTVLDPTLIPDVGFETPEEIVQKNLFLQKKADLLLVEYMLPGRAYIGTDFELAWAKFHGQPTIVFCSEKHKHRVYLKYMATKLASSMTDALEYLATTYPTN
jgi:nucleoside 2-deoxyribosyltransferase